jgi:Tfp pilus assembly protein PilF
MSASRGPDERVVLPRWRTWRTSQSQRELESLSSGASTLDRVATVEQRETELNDRIRDFEQWRGIHYAADVVGTAVVLGLVDARPEVREAATELLGSPSVAARRLAARVLGQAKVEGDEQIPTLPGSTELQPWIAKQKLIVRDQPRNGLAWADLALAHTVLGQDEPAERAIRIALAEANGNRFVLRAAARFYIHREDFGQAQAVLTRDIARLRSDPWLLAAEIAIADSSDRPQRHASHARSMVEREVAAPHDMSELASALATIDLKSGKVRQARRLLSASLVDPTDNSLAQAEWSVPRGVDLVSTEQLKIPRSYEAKARYHYRNKEFTAALMYGQLWLADQPFALDPALFTSYVAATFVSDQTAAIHTCEIGLRANRNNATLLNNLAFSLASSGHHVEAREVIGRAMPDVSSREAAVLTATRGLIEYREGNLEAGQALYRRAVEILVRNKEQVAAASATLFWMYEEILSGGSGLAEVLRQAEAVNKGIGPNEDLALPIRRVEELARRLPRPIEPDPIRALGLRHRES